MNNTEARRPLASRSTRWAAFLAGTAVRAGFTADGISILSLVFAAAGAAALIWLPAPWNLLACAAGIQLRLLCNLLDGMGRQTTCIEMTGQCSTRSSPYFVYFFTQTKGVDDL